MLFSCRSIIAFGLICIGFYSTKIIEKINLPIAVLLLIVTFILCQFNGNIDLYRLKLCNIFLYIINGTFASFGIIFICKSLERNKMLEFWGKNSLIILGTHQLMTRFLLKIYNSSNIIFNLTILILIMMLEYPIINFINNYFPWVIGKEKPLTIAKTSSSSKG